MYTIVIMNVFESSTHSLNIFNEDAMKSYASWASPIVIISDGPYGVKGFPGDPPTPNELSEWYEPHVQTWTKCSTPQTTLWFWGTELSWVNVHHLLEKYGWEYKATNIWDKGIQHIAGNSNTQTLKQLPIVTEICVQYVKKPFFFIDKSKTTMKEWLRHEWERTGLPLYKTNEACGVKNAASRKYFTKDHLWYAPPDDAFQNLTEYSNKYGQESGKPYFSIDGKKPLTPKEWKKLRPKFYCPMGVTNVWAQPPLNGSERIKNGNKAIHLNQKPINLMELIIKTSSDEGDVIWDPFGGLFSVGAAAHNLKRSYFSAEITSKIFKMGEKRLRDHTSVMRLNI